MFDQKTNSIKQLWKNLNTVCSFKQGKSRSNSISKLNVNGVTLQDNKDICNGFNSYFSTVGQNLVDDLIKNNKNTNVGDFKTYCPRSIINSIFITPTDEYEILGIINKLRDSKAPGYDNIGPKLIKYIASLIIRPLTHIFNHSIMTGVVPDKLKIGKVIPVYKKGDSSLPTNYRPISLLSIFDKLLEKLMYKRVYTFLTENNILYPYQFCFRKNHSTSLALIDVIDNIYSCLDNNETVVGIYVDLQKAFDTVDHNILLYKLYNCGVRGIAHKWFVNYLYNRKQFTSVNNAVSMLKNVTCGVPQGSVLGPLLFLIYVNDIAQAAPGVQVKLFADDTNLFLSGIDISELICRSNNCLESLNRWCIANRLHMNFEKNECYGFSHQ